MVRTSLHFYTFLARIFQDMSQKEGESAPRKKVKTSGVPLKSALKNSKSTFTKANLKAVRAMSPIPAVKADYTKPKTPIKSSAVSKDHVQMRPKTSEKGKEKATTPAPPTTFKVVAGTYEKLLYGLEGSYYTEDGQPLEAPRLKPIFIFPSHVASVKAVAASPNGGKWLATGSTDEIVKVWDLRRRKEIGGLVQHEGELVNQIASVFLRSTLLDNFKAPLHTSPFRLVLTSSAARKMEQSACTARGTGCCCVSLGDIKVG